jgi:hypothetical protein
MNLTAHENLKQLPVIGRPNAGRWLECAGIAACFLLLVGGPVPGVNEAHYLVRAKHFWDPAWCPGDFFLQSPGAHEVFFWSVGWLTTWLPLPVVAWIGRLCAAALLSHSLARLCWTIHGQPGVALLVALLYVTLLKWTHMAGEWVVGGVEAKSFAYALVFYALAAIATGRWRWVWLWTGAASAVHVLVGGWATLAALVSWGASRDRLPLRQMWPWLLGGGAISLVGVLPALALDRGVDAATLGQAHMIYVYERLSHHLLVTRFALIFVIRHIAAVLLGGMLLLGLRGWTRDPLRRISLFVIGAVVISMVGGLIDLLLQGETVREAAIMRIYWFRLSDAMVPLLLALLLVQLVRHLQTVNRRISGVVLIASVLLVLANVAGTVSLRVLDRRPDGDRLSLPGYNAPTARRDEVYRQWLEMCGWIREQTPPDALFMTPRRQQTFKWYAERAEVVNWKNVPQGAGAIVEWWKRIQKLIPGRQYGYQSLDLDKLESLMRLYKADYLVTANGSHFRFRQLRRVYPPPGESSVFEVYQLEP